MIKRVAKRIHRIGFQHAIRGIYYSFTTQPNFQIHLAISIFVIIGMFVLELQVWEYVVLIFCIVLGLVVEMVNTAVESVVDLVTQEWRQSAKVAKDVAAGAMLLTAIGTAAVGLLILGPKIMVLL